MARKKDADKEAFKQEVVPETEAPATDKADASAPEAEEKTEKAADAAADGQTFTLTAEEFATAKAHIEKLQKERDDTVALLQRNQADFDNYRRRNASLRQDSLEEGKRDCVKALLPVLDNFDRAMDTPGADESWREGVALVYRQMYDALHKLGMTEVEADGKFDPNLHEAVMQEQAEGKESGDVLAVLQKGYRVGDRIVRHSMVKVAE